MSSQMHCLGAKEPKRALAVVGDQHCPRTFHPEAAATGRRIHHMGQDRRVCISPSVPGTQESNGDRPVKLQIHANSSIWIGYMG